ncbi:hypothetical protein C8J44_2926 [Sphingomonas sp. PP-CE-3A-406]|uniref:hypothetical protein n=1 Tax=Sphingomonas sp. PP-CE-3A-406 TaxID=2135659 RepID=UPI000EFA2997|nr:hypothetical protein [Sphingomonas sp. PP-CE-3A-406]RMB51901.1 hypothetical protein C8J44_2926 [Sphingomonas sp. PP-CE-3A-406]
MKKLPLSKQLIFVGIVFGVAMLTSFVLAFFAAAAAGRSGQPLPSPIIGLSLGVVAGAIYLGLAGNRRVALASGTARQAALAPVVDGSARLIVFRRGFVGKLAGVDVYLDGEVRTQLKSPRFAALTVTPGVHALETRMHNKPSASLTVEAIANATTIIEVEVAMKQATPVQRGDDADLRAVLAGTPMVVA